MLSGCARACSYALPAARKKGIVGCKHSSSNNRLLQSLNLIAHNLREGQALHRCLLIAAVGMVEIFCKQTCMVGAILRFLDDGN